jgi:hypothetical protein
MTPWEAVLSLVTMQHPQEKGRSCWFLKKKKIFLGSSRPNCFYTSVRLYADFIRLLFLHAHREASAMANELPEASDQFRFLRAACLANRKGLSFDFG